MTTLLIGDEERINEFNEKIKLLAIDKVAFCNPNENVSINDLSQYEIVIDASFRGDANAIQRYSELQNRVIILNAVTHSLAQSFYSIKKSKSVFVGMNCLPGFINKPKAELSFCRDADKTMAVKIFEKLNWSFEIVGDRVGMVTPRVVCMIINEAFYTLQEGTASKKDIDMAMKLGTNYPHGPFEWLEIIGVKNVYETLDAIYNDTHEERYKICPMLQDMYLRTL